MDPCTAFGAIWQMQSLNESSLTSVLAFPLLTAPAYWSALLEISPVLQTDEERNNAYDHIKTTVDLYLLPMLTFKIKT